MSTPATSSSSSTCRIASCLSCSRSPNTSCKLFSNSSAAVIASILDSPIPARREPASFNESSASFNAFALLPSSATRFAFFRARSPDLRADRASPSDIPALAARPLNAFLASFMPISFAMPPTATLPPTAAPIVKPAFFIRVSPMKLAVNMFSYQGLSRCSSGTKTLRASLDLSLMFCSVTETGF